jgi:hypothetical protein
VGERSTVLMGCGAYLAFALPNGVKMTALGLEEGSGSARLWLGLPLLAAGLVGLECFRRVGDLVVSDAQRACHTPGAGPAARRPSTGGRASSG